MRLSLFVLRYFPAFESKKIGEPGAGCDIPANNGKSIRERQV
jgi:hypothetical protein